MIFEQLTTAIDSNSYFRINDMVDYRIFLNTIHRWMNSGIWVNSLGEIVQYSKRKIKNIIRMVENPLSKLYLNIVSFFTRNNLITLDRFWADWNKLKTSCDL